MGILKSIFGRKSPRPTHYVKKLADVETALDSGHVHQLFGAKERTDLLMVCTLDANPLAYFNLALLLMYGVGGDRDYDKAEELLKESASQGHSRAYLYLAMIEDEIRHNMPGATAYLKRGVESGDPKCMTDLGTNLMNGHGVAYNRNEAIRLWKMAAKLGQKDAKQNLRKAGH